MKKLAIVAVGIMLAFAMTACGSNTASSSASAESSDAAASEAAASESAASAEASSSTESQEVVVQGESAWSDAAGAEEAAKNAGIESGFTVPAAPPIGDYEWAEPNFNAMDKVVEAHYNGGAVGVSIRKGEGVPLKDLNSDLNEYKFDWTQEVEGIQVACHGYEEGLANFIEWEYENSSYNVWCISTGDGNIGMTEEEVVAMVSGIN